MMRIAAITVLCLRVAVACGVEVEEKWCGLLGKLSISSMLFEIKDILDGTVQDKARQFCLPFLWYQCHLGGRSEATP